MFKRRKTVRKSGKMAISGPMDVVKAVHVDRDLNWQFDPSEDPQQMFQVVKQIGKGGFGVVYQISHVDSQHLFAGKVITPAFLQDNAREELEQEIELMRAIRSAYTVSYYGTMPYDGSLMILMEFCDRGSIRDIIHALEKVLTEEQIAIVLSDVVKGIQIIHDKHHIVHRDIKAANILLTKEGQVKIADFGVSRRFDAGSEQTMTVVGTPYWMAPEVIQGHPYSYPADIWAIGITAVELAEGSPPYMELIASRALVEISTKGFGGYRFPDKHSEPFKHFVAQCLKTEPALRATPARLLADPFLATVQTCSRKDVLADLLVPSDNAPSDGKHSNSLSKPSSREGSQGHSSSQSSTSDATFVASDATFVASDGSFAASSSGSATFVAAGSEPTIIVSPCDPSPAEGSLRVELENERGRRQTLEREVARLSQFCDDLLGRFEKLTRMVEGERLYRRACEYIYGMNGFREPSRHLGLSLLRESTERGSEDAEYVYGRCLSEGTVGAADAGEAMRHIKVAAEQTNSYALAHYGAALHAGRGVEQDRVKGIEFLEQAVAIGNAEGQVLLGRILASGDGIDQDAARAAELFRLSAEQGDPNGQYSYAQVLETGQGVPRDLAAAVQFYRKVIQQGYHNAIPDCERCEQLLSTES